jgi:hypothetical protein
MDTVNSFADHAERTAHGMGTTPRALAFSTALACLSVAYLLSWLELALAMMVAPSDTSGPPLAAMIASRILIGGLYLCVALRLQWARWLTVAVGFASVVVVAPMLGAEWQAVRIAALVSGSALVCKLASALFLISASGQKTQ